MKRKNMPDMVAGNRIARRLSALKQSTVEELSTELINRSHCKECRAQELDKQICYSCIWIHINSIEHRKNNFMR